MPTHDLFTHNPINSWLYSNLDIDLGAHLNMSNPLIATRERRYARTGSI